MHIAEQERDHLLSFARGFPNPGIRGGTNCRLLPMPAFMPLRPI
jgi:hypothetical protein